MNVIRRAFARPGVTIAGAAFAALMTGIVANALLLQKGHHPAPLYKADHSSAQPTVAPEITPSEAPAPPPVHSTPAPVEAAPAPAPILAPSPATASKPSPAPAHLAPSVTHKPKPAKPAVHKDAIGSLLGDLGGKPKIVKRSATAVAPDHTKTKPPAVVKTGTNQQN